MGIHLDFEKLVSKEELIQRLKVSGSNYRTLGEIRDEYLSIYGVDLVWNYVMDDDLHTGFMMVPVREGFLYLPYDEIRRETFEQYLLDEAVLLDTETIERYIKNWQSYSNSLLQAMEEAAALIVKAERKKESGQ